MNGLQLAKHFYFDCVRQIIAAQLPELAGAYAAGLIGYGSDVLGNDDELSRDHEWGPRLVLFLREIDHRRFAEKLDKILGEALPLTFQGFPTRFHRQEGGGNTLAMTLSTAGRHHLALTTPERFMELTLGFKDVPSTEVEWLLIPEQRLLEFTRGAIFADPVGDITHYRQAFAYLPDNVWQYKLSYAFESLSWELDLVALCGQRGDLISMHLNTAITVERMMKLTFLLDRSYCPGYKKWLQREFSRLPLAAGQIEPLLQRALQSNNYADITTNLNRALEKIYQQLRRLNLAANLPSEAPQKNYRGAVVVDGQNIARRLLESIPSPLRKLRLHGAPYGAADQWLTNEDVLLSPAHLKSLLAVYQVMELERDLPGDDMV